MIAYYPRTIDDLRYAVRGRRRVPGFTAAALLMIALGTGANAAMFSVIDAILLRRPFPDSARLALVRVEGADGRVTAAITPAVVFAALTDRIRAIPGVESVAASTAASTRLLSSWLYGDTPLDPQTFVLAALTILAVAAGATYFPARRASRVDPLGALRVE